LQPNLYVTTRAAADITSLAINQELQDSRSSGKRTLKKGERTSKKYKLIKRKRLGEAQTNERKRLG
jgi:hypothetical protein